MSFLQDLLDKKEPMRAKQIIEARAEEVGEALEKFMDVNKIHNFDGERGNRNFEKICNALGYNSTDYFFSDNPGAFEALIEWISGQRNDEWIEGLGGNQDKDTDD